MPLPILRLILEKLFPRLFFFFFLVILARITSIFFSIYFCDLRSNSDERYNFREKEPVKFQRNRNISYHVVLFLNIRDKFQICSLLETLKSNISFFLLRKIDSIIKKKISLCKNYKDTFLREFCSDSRNSPRRSEIRFLRSSSNRSWTSPWLSDPD